MCKKHLIFLFFICTIVFVAMPETIALAARAVADGTDNKIVPATGGGTLDLVANSRCIDGSNLVTWDSRLGLSAGMLPGDTIKTSDLWPIWGKTYFPNVGTRGRGKPVPPVHEWVNSNSHGANADAHYFPGVGGAGATLVAITAVPLTNPQHPLDAAAEAVDPFSLDIGDYDYEWLINSLELEVLEEGGYAGTTMWATDSRFTDPLWELAVVADGPIQNIGNLFIGFYSNPIIGLDDAMVVQQLGNAFSFNSGVASVSNYMLFDTTYTVDQEITYGDGVNAACMEIPEPVTVLLLGFGGLMLRKRSKA